MPEVLEDTNATLQVMSILHDATKGQPVVHNHSKPAGGHARSYLKHSKHNGNHFKNTHKNVTVEVVVKMFVLYLNTRIAVGGTRSGGIPEVFLFIEAEDHF